MQTQDCFPAPCPHCKAPLPENYGYNLVCESCGKAYDYFPDSQIWLELPRGKRIGIGFEGGMATLATVLWKLLK
jgi:predicted amidophosphoribosyltransferase